MQRKTRYLNEKKNRITHQHFHCSEWLSCAGWNSGKGTMVILDLNPQPSPPHLFPPQCQFYIHSRNLILQKKKKKDRQLKIKRTMQWPLITLKSRDNYNHHVLIKLRRDRVLYKSTINRHERVLSLFNIMSCPCFSILKECFWIVSTRISINCLNWNAYLY